MIKLLLIDDEPAILSSLEFVLEDSYEISSYTSPDEALSSLEREQFQICLLDLRIGKESGLDVLLKIKEIQPSIEVIMITAYGSIESSVKALQLGAFSYITKPVDIEEIKVNIKKALQFKQLNSRVEQLSSELKLKYRFKELIGTSRAMDQVYTMINKVSEVDSTVLITGQSGTGKELVARAIHYSGKRKKGPFKVINCAAIPESLLESELFGYEKGAFTGATARKIGKLEMAQGGTVFLDEIGDMPAAIQVKLLRVLQSKLIPRLGSNSPVHLDARVVTATNVDLKKAVAEKKFREDLFFRINVIEIHLPSLRRRKEDIPLIVAHYLRKYNKEYDLAVTGFTGEAMQRLQAYNYPGNIRELINIVEYAMVMASDQEVGVQDLPEHLKNIPVSSSLSDGNLSLAPFVGLRLKELEELFIDATLKAHNGHRRKTAATLGISERNLRYKLNHPVSGE